VANVPVCAADQWYRQTDDEAAAQALISECQRAIQYNSGRRSEALCFASLFEGVELTSFDDRGYQYDNDEVFRDLNIPIVRNTCRSIVQTALSKMTAQDSPLPQFMATGGDWEARTKAVRIDRLVSAEYAQPQGQFTNLHELFRHGALLAMSCVGSFGVFYFAGPENLIAELDDTLTIGLECAGRYGRIISLVRTAWYNAEELIVRFPDFEAEILEAEERMPDGVRDINGELTPERGVKVCQGWRCQIGKKNPGRVLFVLKDGTILNPKKQEYTRPVPPCAFWHYERSLYGHWGVSLTRTIYNQCVRINQIIADVDAAERNSPQNLVLHKKGATKQGDTESAKGWTFIEINGAAANLEDAFKVITPAKYNQQSVELMLLHENGAHDTSGISQQHSAARKSPGTTSGKHENYVAALFTERFADNERRLIDMRTVGSSKLIVYVLQDLLEDVPDYKRVYSKGDYTEEVKLADLDLDVERYSISCAPVSEDKDSPKARADRADKWFEGGLMTGGELLAFYQDFDDKAKSQLILAQENWLERQIDKWLHSDLPTLDYQGPIKWMDLQSAARTVGQALLIARTKGAPDDRIELFTNFLDECQGYMDLESAAAATTLSAEVDPGAVFPGVSGAAAPSPGGAALPGPAAASPLG
jgi:hypothetical protein